ncbi:RBBP9/YdeN family alpha/beta hydrolase [Limnovirga soli]|uniref:Alpha/beta fold hydrolase n=1 Tax=Limnovirga soli TaxID=2656915 RepID=A0A8J8JWU5_9BACT|nr:alpha/beta hydrolase [Limnovirga soli]NNV55671.1 alpha/beta fold hydrolase [Limnovirga soli]
MNHYFIIPGLGNSGPEHWQTYFETTSDNFIRIQQKEWDAPACLDWVNTIEAALKGYDLSKVILIGHSLGCTTIAHWYAQFGKTIKGALLVAPSDIEATIYNFPATGFAPIPLGKMEFKTIVVASTNDPWVSLERAAYFAECWGSDFINIGEAGHINAEAGFYKWQQGLDVLSQLD